MRAGPSHQTPALQPLPTQAATKAGLLAIVKGLQHPPTPLLYGGRKMPDSDAPLNVTRSTSTIALSMAATLQQSQPLDLSCIVQLINQVCQTRAGISTASVCEGQLADPSPSSHSLLINANTQVSTHSVPTPVPYVWCLEPATAGPPTTDMRHPGEANPIPTVNGLAALLAYPNGHYFQPLWNNVLATPKSNSSGSHDLAVRFHGGHPAGTPFDCAGAAGAHHRAVAWGGPVASQNSLMQTVDYLSGDVQQACFREQSLAMLSKAHRAPGNRALIL
ncbi:hypothetical protein CB1_000591031 [Camelus ferus]|nr:hypothetical protein CB1_000591031 [Camelus ferus]